MVRYELWYPDGRYYGAITVHGAGTSAYPHPAIRDTVLDPPKNLQHLGVLPVTWKGIPLWSRST